MAKFQIFTDTASDLPTNLRKENNIDYFRMGFSVNGKEIIADLDFENYSYEGMYAWVRDPNTVIKTSLVKREEFIDKCSYYLDQGIDILYIACTSVLSGTLNFFRLVSEELKEKYPERKLYEIDTKGITIESYIITKAAVELFLAGKSVEEILKWAETEVDKYACYFFADDLKFFAKSGRVSGFAAFMGGIIGIKPILTMGSDGKMASIGKAKGRRNAIAKLVEYVETLGVDLGKHEIVLGHADAPELIEELKAELIAKFGDKLKFDIVVVNPTAGAHCGPDTLGIAFYAKHR